MYKPVILWEEDHPELLPEFRIDIEDMGYELVICTNAEQACSYLEMHIENLSAAILDVDGYLKATDEETSASFHRVRDKINELRNRNPIEFFAFTGKAKYITNKSDFEKSFGVVFDKRTQSNEALEYLKDIVERHADTAIKNRYKEAFAVFNEDDYEDSIIDKSLSKSLINVISSWDDYTCRHSTMMFSVIRPIAEKTLHHLVKLGVIPDSFEKMNQRSLHMSNLSRDFHKEIPPFVARAYHTLFDVCPETLHDCDTFDQVNKGRAPFLLQSLTLELLNVLAWIHVFTKEHPDYHTNQKYFKLQYKYRNDSNYRK